MQESTLSLCPFQKIAFDVIGELHPVFDRGHRFILSIVYTNSRYTEAIPPNYVISQDIAEAVIGVFCRMGFHAVILSGNGTQFVSRAHQSFTDMLSIAQTLYTAQNTTIIFVNSYHIGVNAMCRKTRGITCCFPINKILCTQRQYRELLST